MHFYARSHEGQVILADNAKKHCNYICQECGSFVRVRGGYFRRRHFFHLSFNRLCRQSGKSLEHIQVQYYLQNALPSKEVKLEYSFKEINRIADVLWESQRIIFEVQYSPISIDELVARNQDYRSLGYQVIWIFHDSRYNKSTISEVEHAMQGNHYYFTNIDREGRGLIYDQMDGWQGSFRKVMGKFPITLSLSTINREVSFELPLKVKERLNRSKTIFVGDLVDRCLSNEEMSKKIRGFEKSFYFPLSKWFRQFRALFFKFVIRPYITVFQIVLEKACK